MLPRPGTVAISVSTAPAAVLRWDARGRSGHATAPRVAPRPPAQGARGLRRPGRAAAADAQALPRRVREAQPMGAGRGSGANPVRQGGRGAVQTRRRRREEAPVRQQQAGRAPPSAQPREYGEHGPVSTAPRASTAPSRPAVREARAGLLRPRHYLSRSPFQPSLAGEAVVPAGLALCRRVGSRGAEPALFASPQRYGRARPAPSAASAGNAGHERQAPPEQRGLGLGLGRGGGRRMPGGGAARILAADPR